MPHLTPARLATLIWHVHRAHLQSWPPLMNIPEVNWQALAKAQTAALTQLLQGVTLIPEETPTNPDLTKPDPFGHPLAALLERERRKP